MPVCLQIPDMETCQTGKGSWKRSRHRSSLVLWNEKMLCYSKVSATFIVHTNSLQRMELEQGVQRVGYPKRTSIYTLSAIKAFNLSRSRLERSLAEEAILGGLEILGTENRRSRTCPFGDSVGAASSSDRKPEPRSWE